MGHLITLSTYVPCIYLSYVVLTSELMRHSVGSLPGRYLKLNALPTDLFQLA